MSNVAYAKVQEKGVHIYGLARVTGPFRADRFDGRKRRFKHDAVIQPVGIDLPKDAVAEVLGKGSLRETIHGLDRELPRANQRNANLGGDVVFSQGVEG
jgi:hypothetical protein